MLTTPKQPPIINLIRNLQQRSDLGQKPGLLALKNAVLGDQISPRGDGVFKNGTWRFFSTWYGPSLGEKFSFVGGETPHPARVMIVTKTHFLRGREDLLPKET